MRSSSWSIWKGRNAKAPHRRAAVGRWNAVLARHRDLRRSRRRACRRHCASRYQTGQHLCHEQGTRQDSRFRPGEDCGPLRSWSRNGRAACGSLGCRATYRHWRRAGDGGLYVSGASARRDAGYAQRPVFFRGSAVRNGNGSSSVCRHGLCGEIFEAILLKNATPVKNLNRTAPEGLGRRHNHVFTERPQPPISACFADSIRSGTPEPQA